MHKRVKGLFESESGADEFSGFWWDNANADIGTMNQTYTMCKFPLDERESVLVSLNEIKENSRSMKGDQLNKFCEELEIVVDEIKANARLRKIEGELVEMSEKLSRMEEGHDLVTGEGVNKGSGEDEGKEHERPCTRSRGRVKDYDWVMKTAL